jgi:hypothetical protein
MGNAKVVTQNTNRAQTLPVRMSHHLGALPLVRSDRFNRMGCRAVNTEVMFDGSETEYKEWKAHIDFKGIRDNSEAVQKNADSRKAQADVAKVVELYSQYLDIKNQSDAVREERNISSGKMKAKLDDATRQV